MRHSFPFKTLPADLVAAFILSLVALPLGLGLANASGAPLLSGILAGVVGGLVVGALSGSPLSVSGPSPSLTAVLVAELANLGSFENFLTAVLVSGVIQIGFGLIGMGSIAAFFPSSVIKGLLAAIG